MKLLSSLEENLLKGTLLLHLLMQLLLRFFSNSESPILPLPVMLEQLSYMYGITEAMYGNVIYDNLLSHIY